MTSGGIYKYPGFEGTRISLSLAFGRHLVSLYPSPVCDSLPVYQLSLVFLDMLLLKSPGGLLCGIQNSECRKEA